jgi:hypothetical protein
MASLEETIRDLAQRGEISHISLVPTAHGWRATFAACSIFGNSFAEDKDPCTAIMLACDTAKIRRRAPFEDGAGKLKLSVEPVAQPVLEAAPGDVDSLV